MDAILTSSQHYSRRQRLAKSRMKEATSALTACHLCHHHCGADRSTAPAGRCGAGPSPHVFSAQVEVGDELEILPTYAVALSGCNMRCSFCITGDESWHPSRGEPRTAKSISNTSSKLIQSGRAKSLQILGGEPAIHLPWLLEIASHMPADAPLVLKTNGLCTAPARNLLDQLFDIWIVDLKFGNDTCAHTLSRTSGYTAAVHETLLWASTHTHLIIRHLLLPGHVECCWRPVAEWIADRLPTTKVSLRSGYWPSWHAAAHAPLHRPLHPDEFQTAMEIATHFRLHLVP